MILLHGLGLLSLVFVAGFTAWAYRDDGTPSGRQSGREAIIEVWIGMAIGFALNWLLNWLILPLVGARFSAIDNVAIGLLYTAVSVVRGYVVRRWADVHIKGFASRLTRQWAA